MRRCFRVGSKPIHPSIVTSVSKPLARTTFDRSPVAGAIRSLGDLCRSGLAYLVVVAAVMVLFTSCVGGQIPEVPPSADGTRDPLLVEGRTVWADHCVRCHGAGGDGGRGPKLSNGAVAIKYPNIDVQISIVTQGLNGKMPGFRTVLTPDEIDAVAAFTREVL